VLRGEVPGETSWHGLDGQTDRGLEENRPANQESEQASTTKPSPATSRRGEALV